MEPSLPCRLLRSDHQSLHQCPRICGLHVGSNPQYLPNTMEPQIHVPAQEALKVSLAIWLLLRQVTLRLVTYITVLANVPMKSRKRWPSLQHVEAWKMAPITKEAPAICMDLQQREIILSVCTHVRLLTFFTQHKWGIEWQQ